MSGENEGGASDAITKWAVIGLFVGGGFPFLVGGWIQEYFYICAFATCFLFGWIALEGAKSHEESVQIEKPKPSVEEVKPKIDLNFKYISGSEIEDEGFLRRYFTCSVFEKQLNIMAIVDYNGIGPSGETRKQAITFMFDIEALNIKDATIFNYESTESAIEAFKNLNEINIPLIFNGILQNKLSI